MNNDIQDERPKQITEHIEQAVTRLQEHMIAAVSQHHEELAEKIFNVLDLPIASETVKMEKVADLPQMSPLSTPRDGFFVSENTGLGSQQIGSPERRKSKSLDHAYLETLVARHQADELPELSSMTTSMSMMVAQTSAEGQESLERPESRRSRHNKPKCQQRLDNVVKSFGFDIFCACVVLASTLLVGIEVEIGSADNGHKDTDLRDVHTAINCWYILEISLRVISFRKSFFTGTDWRFNMFDLILSFSVALDMLFDSAKATTAGQMRIVRVVRFFRIGRTLRLYRQLRFVREFRKMVYSLATSLMTLLWSCALLFFILYAFGVYLCASVSDYTAKKNHEGTTTHASLVEHFGSLWKTIYTLFLCISTGAEWGVYAKLLLELDLSLVLLFIGFMFIVLFGAVNVILAVFVDSAMRSTQHYQDLFLQESERNRELFIIHIRNIFKAMDTDNSGCLSMAEMIKFLSDDDVQLQTYFNALELNASDAKVLFKLLDMDGSGVIDIDEFCAGCMRLKGNAKSFDVHCGIYEMNRLFHYLSNRIDHLQQVVSHQGRQVPRLDFAKQPPPKQALPVVPEVLQRIAELPRERINSDASSKQSGDVVTLDASGARCLI